MDDRFANTASSATSQVCAVPVVGSTLVSCQGLRIHTAPVPSTTIDSTPGAFTSSMPVGSNSDAAHSDAANSDAAGTGAQGGGAGPSSTLEVVGQEEGAAARAWQPACGFGPTRGCEPRHEQQRAEANAQAHHPVPHVPPPRCGPPSTSDVITMHPDPPEDLVPPRRQPGTIGYVSKRASMSRHTASMRSSTVASKVVLVITWTPWRWHCSTM